jgi:glycosyltransferase involved in cell wall biosynthesis
MKVDWVIGHFFPEIGGAETHVKEISSQLIERGHEVTVHTNSITVKNENLPLQDEVDGIKILRYKPSMNWSFYFSKFKPKIENTDIIALEGYPSMTNDYVIRKYGSLYPHVVYSLGVVLATSGFSSILKGIYDRIYGIKTLKMANRIIGLTTHEKQWCVHKGIEAKKIEIIPAGIFDEAFGDYDGNKMMQKFPFKRYILFIGRMYTEKSPTHLVSAFSKINKDYADLGVVFVGPDIGEVSKVKSLAEELGIKEKIVYAGKVPDSEKYALLSGCEFFVLPTKIEAQGIVFAEAWAQKKAVIGTRVGAVPYVISEGKDGLLYNYGDINSLSEKIRFLLNNPKKVEEMGEKGFEKTRNNYRWDRVIDKTEEVYTKVIEEFTPM